MLRLCLLGLKDESRLSIIRIFTACNFIYNTEISYISFLFQGFGGNVSHTFHLHGYNASIVGWESFERPVTKNDVESMDHNGKIHRNLVNPVQKDTFVVPNKGYIILRFYTDNLGENSTCRTIP